MGQGRRSRLQESVPLRFTPVFFGFSAFYRLQALIRIRCVFRRIFKRHVIFEDFVGSDFALVGIRPLQPAGGLGFKGLSFIEKFADAFRSGRFVAGEAHVVTGLAGGFGTRSAFFPRGRIDAKGGIVKFLHGPGLCTSAAKSALG